jgi:hypothetical protein
MKNPDQKGRNWGQRVETRTDEVKKGMFSQRKTPHGAYIKAPQASEPQTYFRLSLTLILIRLNWDVAQPYLRPYSWLDSSLAELSEYILKTALAVIKVLKSEVATSHLSFHLVPP